MSSLFALRIVSNRAEFLVLHKIASLHEFALGSKIKCQCQYRPAVLQLVVLCALVLFTSRICVLLIRERH